jgi:CRP/FNR family transcriptional regulator, cyclic AMP receptor protein
MDDRLPAAPECLRTEIAMDVERIARLQQTPVFGGLSARTLQSLIAGSRPVNMPAGGLFMREGQLGDAVYVLERGRVAVLKDLGGELRLLKELGPGDCFGEMALLDVSPRSATVRAIEECQALEISAAALYKIYEQDLEQFSLLSLNMGREVSRRLRETERLLGRHGGEEPA